MKMVNLEDVCEIIAGQSPPSENYNQDGLGIPFFQGKADFNDLFPTVRYWCNKPLKIALPNDILLSVRAPVGPTNICNQESCIGRGLSAIRAGKKVDYRYLLYFFRANENKLSSQGRGSTFSAITQSEIREIKFPLLLLSAQKKIASILEQADTARQKRKQANQLTDQFLQSTFIEMFGDPVRNGKNYPIKVLENICDKITDGTHDTPKRLKEGVKFITGKNIRAFKIDFTDLDFVTEEVHREIFRRCNPVYGDILYTNIGVNLGTAVMNNLIEEFSMKNVALLKLNKNILASRYVEHLLNNPEFKISILRRFSIGGAQSFLSLGNINQISIPLPPLLLQKKFAILVEQVEQLRVKQRESENELENLFNSLMQKYFRS